MALIPWKCVSGIQFISRTISHLPFSKFKGIVTICYLSTFGSKSKGFFDLFNKKKFSFVATACRVEAEGEA
jgi:hypothetical protein